MTDSVESIPTEKPIPKVRDATNASNKKQHGSKIRKDQRLKELLASADEITSIEHFTYWKDEFLETFQKYLDPEETCNAREADEALYVHMQKLAKICLNLKELCKNGGITEERCTVKGQRAVNEFVAEMTSTENLLHVYFPKTLEDEGEVGYTKFNLAAVLVRDGFRVYDLMITCRDYVVNLRDNEMSSENVLSRNHRAVIQFYFKEVESFCDCLADLGMYKLMNKCVELYKVRPRSKKKKPFNKKTMGPLSDTEDEKQVNGGRMFRKSKHNFRSIMDDGWTSGVTREQVKSGDEAEEGIDGTNESDQIPQEDKPDPNKPNEWIYYYDPVNDVIGKVPRKLAVGTSFIVTTNDSGKEELEDAVEEWDGKEGKSELIWKLKDACKGKGKKGAKK